MTVLIPSHPLWVDTGIQLAEGAIYALEATGTWTDWTIACGADGYDSDGRLLLRLTEWLRRAPHERWFALIGAIDRNMQTKFLIGTSATIVAPTSGMLTCFANDVAIAYWNNSGQVELSVRRME